MGRTSIRRCEFSERYGLTNDRPGSIFDQGPEVCGEVWPTDNFELRDDSTEVVAGIPRQRIETPQGIETVSGKSVRFRRAAEAEKARREGGSSDPGFGVLVAEGGFEHRDALAQNRLGLTVLLTFDEKTSETRDESNTDHGASHRVQLAPELDDFAEDRFDLFVLVLIVERRCEVLSYLDGIWVGLLVHPFQDRQRLPVPMLGLAVSVLGLQEVGQIVEGARDLGVVRPENPALPLEQLQVLRFSGRAATRSSSG